MIEKKTSNQNLLDIVTDTLIKFLKLSKEKIFEKLSIKNVDLMCQTVKL